MIQLESMRFLLTIAALAASNAPAQTSFVVSGKANIYAAGQTAASDGELPCEVSFNPQAVQAVEFVSVKGVVSNGVKSNGPDGFVGGSDPNVLGTMIESANGLSSIAFLRRFTFLTGVFLPPSKAQPPAPVGLIFTDADKFESLSPLTAQTFFVGDGLTGTGEGTRQIFLIPAGATRLFLGISDICVVTAFAPPNCYSDNSGSFTGEITFLTRTGAQWAPVAPESASVRLSGY